MSRQKPLPTEVRQKILQVNGKRNFNYGRLVGTSALLRQLADDPILPVDLRASAAKAYTAMLQATGAYQKYVQDNPVSRETINNFT